MGSSENMQRVRRPIAQAGGLGRHHIYVAILPDVIATDCSIAVGALFIATVTPSQFSWTRTLGSAWGPNIYYYEVSEEGKCFDGAGNMHETLESTALALIHSHGCVRCDLDLHSLLLTDSGDVVLCDFAGSRIE